MAKEFYIELIYKSLAAGLSAEEQRQLDDWLSASDENQETANNIRQGWELSANYSKDIEVNLDDEFALLQKSIGIEKNPNIKIAETARVKKLNPWKTWMSIAAAGLLLVAPYFIFNPSSAQPQIITIHTQNQEIKEVELPDGTKVWLNENSTLTYPSPFEKLSRNVELKGLAFFDVARDEKKPFHIEADDVGIKVLGTSFSVRAIESEATVEVVVKTGKVRVKGKGNTATLEKGRKAIYNKNENRMSTTTAKSLNEVAWYNNILTFDETEWAQTISDLENHYKVQLNLENSSMIECPITYTAENIPLSNILNDFSKMFNLKVEKSSDKIYNLVGGECANN